MQHSVTTDSINVIVGEFSHDLLELTENKLSDIFIDLAPIVNKPTLSK